MEDHYNKIEKLKNIEIENANEALPFIKERVNFLELKEEVNIQARQTIENIVSFFFDVETTNDSVKKMLQTKMDLDVISLNTVIYQLKTSDYAIAQILNEINIGISNQTIRLFESLNGLQKINIDSTKLLSSMLAVFEKQYADLKKYMEENSLLSIKAIEDNGEVHRGTRALLQNISNIDDEIEHLNGSK